MSHSSTTQSRRRRQWRIAVVLALCTGVVAVIGTTWHVMRVERLVNEINQSSDGFARLGMPAWERVWERLHGNPAGSGAWVKLPSNIDREWLELRNYLADLPIGFLQVHDEAGDGSWLAPLVVRHPIRILTARGVKATDTLAPALMECRELRELHLWRSDLSDAGLQRLPLEQIQSLNIADTRVTAEGLRALQRARRLEHLNLGVRQIGVEAVSLPVEMSGAYSLWIYGPEVTDAELQSLMSALNQCPTTKMRGVVLYDSSVTSAAADAWAKSFPNIGIELRKSRTR